MGWYTIIVPLIIASSMTGIPLSLLNTLTTIGVPGILFKNRNSLILLTGVERNSEIRLIFVNLRKLT